MAYRLHLIYSESTDSLEVEGFKKKKKKNHVEPFQLSSVYSIHCLSLVILTWSHLLNQGCWLSRYMFQLYLGYSPLKQLAYLSVEATTT